MLASVGYASGIVGSTALAKRRPRFDELFKFPKDPNESINLEKSKADMIVWAERVNREARKEMKGK